MLDDLLLALSTVHAASKPAAGHHVFIEGC